MKARRVGKQVRHNLEQVAGQIKKAGGKVMPIDPNAPVGGSAKPLGDSFYADFEEPDVEDEVSQEPKKTFILFRPIKALFRAIGKGLSVFFTNFFRYALVIAITVGLASLIHLALEGQLGG